MAAAFLKHPLAAPLWTLPLLALASFAMSAEVRNITGMPAYPNISSAVMEGVMRTDTLGHWCMRFWSDTTDSLAMVETWYRKELMGASETDLSNDKTYKSYTSLSGIKLALGIDYVAVYKATSQAPTTIDLYRCSPVK